MAKKGRVKATAAPVSPYASGGGGVRFEHRFGAFALARMLTGTTISALGNRAPTRVAFQKVDDLVLMAEGGDFQAVHLAIACRRRPQFTRSNAETRGLFVSLVRAEIAAESCAEVEGRIAVVVSGHQGGASEVGELANLARNQVDAESYFSLITEQGQYSAKLRSRLSHLKDLVGNALASIAGSDAGSIEHRCWSLLRRLYVLSPDLEPANDGDWAALADLLKPWSVAKTTDSAIALRNELDILAGELAQTKANVDANTLRRRLHSLIDPTAHRLSVGWKRLLLIDREARSSVQRTIMGSGARGGVILKRTAMRKELAEALQAQGADLLVKGESGVGKSVAVLDAVEPSALGNDCQALVINLRDLPGTPLDLIAALSEPLEELLAGLTAPCRLLVMDAAESVAENRRDVFVHILRTAREAGITVVAVAASEGASVVIELMKAGGIEVREYIVPSLSDEEISGAVQHFPELNRLADDPKGRELLRRPIVIELLARAGDPGVPLSDADALEHVWKELVRNGERCDAGLPDAREQVMLSLAAHALNNGPLDTLLARLDPKAVAGLRQSALLRPRSELPWERLPEFAHDLIRAYAVARQLLATRDPASELRRIKAPRWALPAARLACELLLSSPDSTQDPFHHRFKRLQAAFDDLAAAGHGERWADVPTEAMLAIAHPLPVLQDAWSSLQESKAQGVRRLFRILKLRHRKGGVIDLIAGEPVITQLFKERASIFLDLEDEAAEVTRSWLIGHVLKRTPKGQPTRIALGQAIAARCAANESDLDRHEAEARAAQAARTPEEEAADERRRMHLAWPGPRSRGRKPVGRNISDWIDESSIAHLALLGPDLSPSGEAILRRIAKEEPRFLGPAVETLRAGQALADFDPALLVDLVEAYYLDDEAEDGDGFGYRDLHDEGIREHIGGGIDMPLSAYYRGPFLAMFLADYRRGVACLNRLLNHAARHRIRSLSELEHSPVPEEQYGQYIHELAITGEPRNYIGDDNVWLWYRAMGVGPYPCMSALQALELVSDELIRMGAPVPRLAPLLLEGAESLAMPAFVLGLLVRHLEKAGTALDAFLVEPLIWKLEFTRCVREQTGLMAAHVPGLVGPERRTWTLYQASTMLMFRAEGGRVGQLRALGERLLATARMQVGADSSPAAREFIAAVQKWAASLDRTAHRVELRDGQFLIQQAANPEVEAVLGPRNAELIRSNEGVSLLVKHGNTMNTGGRAPETSSESLAADLLMARELLSHPPETALRQSLDGPVAVAASAVELHFGRGVEVTDSDLEWSAAVVLEVAAAIHQQPRADFDHSVYPPGADRSAGRALPYLLLPAALTLRRSIGIESEQDVDHLVTLSRAVASSASNEVRLAYARSLDAVWSVPCSKELQGRCHHRVAWEIVGSLYHGCVMGSWDNQLQRRTIAEVEPFTALSADIDADSILVPRLSAAIRACGSAAIGRACVRLEAQQTLDALLAAHARVMLAHKHGYHQSHNDSLVAARAALWQATDGRDGPLLDHVRAYLGDSRALAESLRAINAAADEGRDAGAAACRLWPKLMDLVLDAAADHPAVFADHHWGDSVLARLIPDSTYERGGYLTSELSGDPLKWRDLLAWSQQVDRWLRVAVGSRESIDSLVIAVRELKVADQIDTGLKWVEQIVQGSGNSCANTFTLPEWLRERRADLATPEQETRWQRVVDLLAVAGDSRVADLAD